MRQKLLLVEDDDNLKKMVAYFFPENTVFTASDVDEAVRLLKETGNFDAVVLDLILRSSVGTDLFREFPALPPVVILPSLDGEDSPMTGLTSGAADYVIKPCSMRLWETHIALRLLPKTDAVETFGNFSVNANTRTVKDTTIPVSLTPSGFNILFF